MYLHHVLNVLLKFCVRDQSLKVLPLRFHAFGGKKKMQPMRTQIMSEVRMHSGSVGKAAALCFAWVDGRAGAKQRDLDPLFEIRRTHM